MLNLLLISLTISLISVGFFTVTQEGFLLYPVRQFIYKLLPEPKYKNITLPIIGCYICMASVWGLAGLLIASFFYPVPLWYYMPNWFIVAALNQFIYR